MQHHIHPNRLGRHMHKTNHASQQKKRLLFISKYKDTSSLAFNALLDSLQCGKKLAKSVSFSKIHNSTHMVYCSSSG